MNAVQFTAHDVESVHVVKYKRGTTVWIEFNLYAADGSQIAEITAFGIKSKLPEILEMPVDEE